MAEQWWHGGGRIKGDQILPSLTTGVSRSGAAGVHVTTDRDLAATYAATVDGQSWVFEVEPFTEPEPVASLVQPDAEPIAFVTTGARIVRRFTLSNRERSRRRAAVMPARGLL